MNKESFLHEKSKLKDWFHYSIEINVLKNDYKNFNLREFKIKIKRQEKNLSMTNFKEIKILTCFHDLLQDLIPKLKMYSCYIRFNEYELYDLNVHNFYNNIGRWRESIQSIYEKYDKKENKYQKEINI